MDEKPLTPDPDDDGTLEGCVDNLEDGTPAPVTSEPVTLDEDLPVAEGGVA